eukprot:3723925-Prymnesium_polylepis.1
MAGWVSCVSFARSSGRGPPFLCSGPATKPGGSVPALNGRNAGRGKRCSSVPSVFNTDHFDMSAACSACFFVSCFACSLALVSTVAARVGLPPVGAPALSAGHLSSTPMSCASSRISPVGPSFSSSES